MELRKYHLKVSRIERGIESVSILRFSFQIETEKQGQARPRKKGKMEGDLPYWVEREIDRGVSTSSKVSYKLQKERGGGVCVCVWGNPGWEAGSTVAMRMRMRMRMWLGCGLF